MTTSQSFKIYAVLQRHFKNDDDAKIAVQEIEQIIDAKVDSKKDVLATKEDLALIKGDIFRFQIDVEKRFNSVILWIVGTGLATVGLIFSIIKLFIIQ